jgi:hypothetical protein
MTVADRKTLLIQHDGTSEEERPRRDIYLL